jgi:hypothetical protein
MQIEDSRCSGGSEAGRHGWGAGMVEPAVCFLWLREPARDSVLFNPMSTLGLPQSMDRSHAIRSMAILQAPVARSMHW